ncbi:MAG: PKD domain-containing protein [Nitrospirae bacterium]|nr:PKD domain-containing protein [Nitrospirota bacterium]
MDFEGDGIIDYTGASFESISHTYTLEGIFYPTLYVTDTQGNIYSDVIAITVLSKTEMDNMPVMAEMLQDMADIRLIESKGNRAEYDLLMVKESTEHAFYVEFVKDVNGIWKINFF